MEISFAHLLRFNTVARWTRGPVVCSKLQSWRVARWTWPSSFNPWHQPRRTMRTSLAGRKREKCGPWCFNVFSTLGSRHEETSSLKTNGRLDERGWKKHASRSAKSSTVVCQVGLSQRLEAARMLAAVACKRVVGSGSRFWWEKTHGSLPLVAYHAQWTGHWWHWGRLIGCTNEIGEARVPWAKSQKPTSPDFVDFCRILLDIMPILSKPNMSQWHTSKENNKWSECKRKVGLNITVLSILAEPISIYTW